MPTSRRVDTPSASLESIMEMHEIRYFLAASQALNFHRAAELVHVTQPALTRAIQKLEAELGGALFHRERNGVQLTEFGSLMRGRLEEVVQRSEDARQTARSFLQLEAAPLTLGVMCTIARSASSACWTPFVDATRASRSASSKACQAGSPHCFSRASSILR
jgi:DNA-binding transcriptional LysR family regulator